MNRSIGGSKFKCAEAWKHHWALPGLNGVLDLPPSRARLVGAGCCGTRFIFPGISDFSGLTAAIAFSQRGF